MEARNVSDEDVVVVSTLGGVARTNRPLIDVLLAGAGVTVEQRSVELPLSGDVKLAIVRTADGAGRSMDLVEAATREAEGYMGSPLPTRYVGVLFEDAVPPGTAGTNFGSHITVLPKFDVDDDSREAELTGRIMAHEVAHYYWSNNADWIDEGMGETLASHVQSASAGQPAMVTNYPCPMHGP